MDGVLSRVPGLAGYLSGQANDQQMQMGQLQQFGAMQGILAKQQAMQQEQEIRGVLSKVAQETGGDPAKMVPALLRTGTPIGIKLAEGMKGLLPPPATDRVVAPGSSVFSPDGTLKFTAPDREPKPQNPSDLARLISERDALPEGDPRRTAYENAIRKNSETAKQIVPPIVVNTSRGKAPAGYRFSSDGETLEPIPGGPKATDGTGKPLPTQALRLQQAELDSIGTAGAINADMGALISQIDSGSLKLGPVRNIGSEARNFAGMSNEESRNYASFRSTLEKIRNDSLRLNKGVQTEGDSVRAWNELIKSANDPQVVKQRLQEIQKINERAIDLRKSNIDTIRRNYGAGSLDTGAYQNQPAALGAPKAGAVMDGYRFKGGDPAKPENWIKQ